jgi:hypothetical protein
MGTVFSGREVDGCGPKSNTDIQTATLTVGEEEITLPLLTDSFGHRFVDVQRLYAEHKVCTYDPGFMSTASCCSRLVLERCDALFHALKH